MELRLLKRYLPKTFFKIIPLQNGMELILLYTAINKMSGLFGLLSLFTNHAINFMQWTYYVLNCSFIIISIFTYTHLRQLSNQASQDIPLNSDANISSIKIIALFLVVYILDFFIGNIFMIYLTNLWFEEEYSSNSASDTASKSGQKHLVKRVSSILAEQSASEGYEVFVSSVTILLSEIIRVYFIAIAIGYYLRLRKRISRPCMGFGASIVDFLDRFN